MESSKKKKILMLGLDNSGKTSIILNRYQKETNLLTYLSLKPTRKIEISNIENEEFNNVSIWDLGGQKKYRDGYIAKMREYLPKTDEVVYVLDIQDKKRYDEALAYFGSLIESIKEVGIKLKVSLYLHKMDPGLEKIDPSINDEFLENLTKRFIDKVPEELDFEIFKTTIYTFFRMMSYHFSR